MGTGIKRWEGFRGLRTYQPVLQADLRELERVVLETQRMLGSLIENDPIGGTTVINTTSITNISSAMANPTASVVLTAVNGTATTAMRSDAAPPLSQAIAPTWTGVHTFSVGSNDAGVVIQRTASQTSADLLQILTEGFVSLGTVNNDGWLGLNTDGPTAWLTVAAGAAGAPSPPVANPLAWYIPESITEDNGGTEPASGTSLAGFATWRDSTGNGYDLDGVAGSGSGPAYYRAGHARAPAAMATCSFEAQFAPGTDWGYFSPASVIEFNTTDGWTVAAIFHDYHNNALDDPSQLWLLGSSGNDNHQQTVEQNASAAGGTVTCSVGSTARYYGESDTSLDTDGGSNYIVFRLYGSTVASEQDLRMWVNGVLADQHTTSGEYGTIEAGITYDVIGTHFGSRKSRNLTLSELIIYDRDLSDVEVATLNSYLAARLAGGTLDSSGGSSGAPAGDLTHWNDDNYNTLSRVNTSGWLGIGVDPIYPLDVISTEASQTRVGYDESNYFTTSVSVAGAVTFDATGASAGFTFSDAVTLSSTLLVTGATTLNAPLTLTSTTTPQATIRYDASNHLGVSVSASGLVTLNATGASAGFVFSDFLGIGTTPANPLHVLNTTGPQARIAYDTSNYTTFDVSNAGRLIIDANGTSNYYLVRINGSTIFAINSTDLDFVDAINLQFGTTTGTKIGTGTTQKIGFWNATPVVQSTGWSVSNETTDKSYDADSTSIDELADVLGTLIETLKTYGILGA